MVNNGYNPRNSTKGFDGIPKCYFCKKRLDNNLDYRFQRTEKELHAVCNTCFQEFTLIRETGIKESLLFFYNHIFNFIYVILVVSFFFLFIIYSLNALKDFLIYLMSYLDFLITIDTYILMFILFGLFFEISIIRFPENKIIKGIFEISEDPGFTRWAWIFGFPIFYFLISCIIIPLTSFNLSLGM
jgi:hypothetical protein